MISFHKFLGGAFVIQLFLGTTVMAATAPSYLAPANSFIYVESNTTQPNPLKGQLENILKEAMGDVTNQSTLDTIAKNLDSTTLSFSTSAHQQDGSDIYFLSVAIPESDFQTILDELADTDLVSTDIGQQKMIYLTGDDFYFTYKDGNLLASNKKGMISDLLLVHDLDSINKVPDWQFLNSKSSGHEFLRLLVNFQNMPESALSDSDLGDLQITDLVKSEGFTFEQTDNGLKALVMVNPGAKLAALTLQTPFVPELYKKINPNGILLYSESYNWAKNMETGMSLITSLSSTSSVSDVAELYAELKNAILEATGLNMETDIVPLFQNRSALAIHDESSLQYAPSFTLISEVKGQESKAKTTLSKMNERIITSMTESFNTMYDQEVSYREQLKEFFADDPSYTETALPDKAVLMKSFFSTDTKTVNGSTFTQITINPDANSYFYMDDYTPDLKANFTISSTVTPEGLMIVTSSKNLEQLLNNNGGLMLDSEWQKSYQGTTSMLEVAFLNLNNVSKYITALGTSMGATEEDLAPVIAFMAPLHSILTKSTYDSTSGYYLGEIKLNMDLTAFADMAKAITDMFASWQSPAYSEPYWNDFSKIDLSEPTLFRHFNFTDITDNAWFSAYAYHMANLGIMKGYDNNEFRPAQNITRAEFTKTIISAYEIKYGETFTNVIPLEGFSDIHSNDWYYSYVNTAKTMNLITGYQDGSFRPNQPITRAEAVTILVRLWNIDNYYFDEIATVPFTDISTNDWFYTSVEKAFNLNFVNGKTATTFAPNDFLSRAETAAMVSRFLTNN